MPAFTNHSFRIGATSYASQIGHTETQIKVMGRWRSKAYSGYVRGKETLKVKGKARMAS